MSGLPVPQGVRETLLYAPVDEEREIVVAEELTVRGLVAGHAHDEPGAPTSEDRRVRKE